MKKINYNHKIYKTLFIVLGSISYAVGMNLFVVPMGLYSGGVLGIAQITRTLIEQFAGFSFHFDISGVISFIFNVPLIIFAYFKIGKGFIIKTILCVAFQSILLSFIPVITITNNILTSCIIGGVFCGAGIGLLLRNGGSSGGIDIIGVYLTKRSALTIGAINLIIDSIVFACVFVIFGDAELIIHTLIFAAVTMISIDKLHSQNINSQVIIISKLDNGELQRCIINELQRGVSYWNGLGAYTGERIQVIYTVVSKYELANLKRLVRAIDSNAFISVNNGISLDGYFEKRL